jgi:23S rRNA (uracil1939-C5)-methyltransferase
MPILSGVKRRSPTPKVPHRNAGPAGHETVELTIEKMVPGGEGLARREGKVIFVAGALTGERLKVRLTGSKKDYARGEIAEILAPSPERITPPCPVAGRCGGCDWQHLAYPEQLRQKVALAEDALRRVGGIAWPGLAIEPGKPWGYRNRVQFHRSPDGRLGFLGRGSHEVIPVSACPVSDPALNALLSTDPATPADPASASPATGARFPAATGGPSAEAAGRLLAWGHAGAAARADGEIAVEILGKTIRFDNRCFFQSNLGMLEKLIPHVLEGLPDRHGEQGGGPGGDRALDLYCGVGLFGAFLADRYRSVLAVEENAASLAHARGNIPGTSHAFLEGRLEDLVQQGRLGDVPDLVLVDPPRPGLDQAVRDWLAETRPPRLVYVSCNPVTLARDLKSLLAAGFTLTSLRLFDFYPQTAHVEAVAKLEMRP